MRGDRITAGTWLRAIACVLVLSLLSALEHIL